jgi:hypothetical protein
MTLTFSLANLQHEFSHANDFGVLGNWSKHSGSLFQHALEEVMVGPATIEYGIEFRGLLDYRIFLDQRTGKAVIFDGSGNFRAAWNLGAEQVKGVTVNGRLW